MKKYFIACGVCMGMLFSMFNFSLVSAASTYPLLSCSSDTCQTEIDNSAGFSIALDSSPSTGYQWTLSYDTTLLKLDSSNPVSLCPSTSISGGITQITVGCGQKTTYNFSALKAGKAQITATYKSPSGVTSQIKYYNIIINSSPINGVCGSSADKVFGTAPTTNLCASGTASAVNGGILWTWTCSGLNGGSNAYCGSSMPSMTVSKSSSTPSSMTLTPGQKNVKFAVIDFTAYPATTVDNLERIEISSSDSLDASLYLNNIKVFKGTTQIGTISELSYDGSSYQGWIYPNFVIPAGATESLSIYADVKPTATSASIRLGVRDIGFSGTASALNAHGLPVFGSEMTIKSSAINGTCGSSNQSSFSSVPTTNLCASGTVSSVSGSGPWSWSCSGLNGGTTASCSAKLISASCVKENYSIPVTPVGLTQSCCSGLTLCPADSSVNGSRGTCKSSCSTVTTCTDSDGGKNYYVKGTIESCGTKSVDFCASPTPGADSRVIEYYCSGVSCNPLKGEYGVASVEYSCPNGCKDGACVASKGAALSYSVDSSSASSSDVMAGSSNSPFLNIKLTAIDADVNVYYIRIDRVGGSNKDLTSIKLFDGSTLLETYAVHSEDTSDGIAYFYPNIAITKDSYKVLSLKADVSSNATVGDKIALSVSSIIAVGDVAATANGKTVGNSMTIASSLVGESACGSAARTYSSSETSYGSDTFCLMGTASPVSPVFPTQNSSTSWSCIGLNGGSTTSCSASKTNNYPVFSCTNDSNGCNGKAIVGDKFSISLDGNASTGYQWSLVYDTSLLQLDNSKSISLCPSVTTSGGITQTVTGCGETTTYNFSALKAGTVKITANYSRSWESVQPKETKYYNISVSSPSPISIKACGANGIPCTGDTSSEIVISKPFNEMSRDELIKFLINLIQSILAKK